MDSLINRLNELLETYPKSDPEYTSQDSMGNYDDVFYDGFSQGEYHVASAIRNIINDYEVSEKESNGSQ